MSVPNKRIFNLTVTGSSTDGYTINGKKYNVISGDINDHGLPNSYTVTANLPLIEENNNVLNVPKISSSENDLSENAASLGGRKRRTHSSKKRGKKRAAKRRTKR